MEERIVELEIKVAYQEDLLQTLNRIIGKQQLEINRLESTCQLLHERIKSLSENNGGAKSISSHGDYEIPPHY